MPNFYATLRNQYAMSPQIARFAIAFLNEVSIARASSEIGVEYASGRQYLKILFRKTDTNSQAELIKVLISILLEKPIRRQRMPKRRWIPMLGLLLVGLLTGCSSKPLPWYENMCHARYGDHAETVEICIAKYRKLDGRLYGGAP